MKFSHRFQVRASLAEVAAFHSASSALKDITPPLVIMRVHAAPETMTKGDETDFTMWLGPFPIRFVARIEEFGETGFVDRQMRGPFKTWVHTHSFVAIEEDLTEVQDDIEATFGGGWYDRLSSFLMWFGLPILFAFRGWKTRRLLEK